jgi:hypothetical protein
MFKNIVFRFLAGLVLLAALAGIAFFAYNAGMAQGASVNLPAPANGQVMPYYGYGMPFFHPFFGFGCFAPLIVLFLVFAAFGAMRRMLWGPRMMGWRHMHHEHGPWGDKNAWENGVPPMMAEMHRRMHAAENEKPAGESAQK